MLQHLHCKPAGQQTAHRGLTSFTQVELARNTAFQPARNVRRLRSMSSTVVLLFQPPTPMMAARRHTPARLASQKPGMLYGLKALVRLWWLHQQQHAPCTAGKEQTGACVALMLFTMSGHKVSNGLPTPVQVHGA